MTGKLFEEIQQVLTEVEKDENEVIGYEKELSAAKSEMASIHEQLNQKPSLSLTNQLGSLKQG